MKKLSWPALVWFVAATVAVIADRTFKAMALQGTTIGRGKLFFTLFPNKGIAFSLPLPPVAFWILTVPIFVTLVVLFVRAWRTDLVRAGVLFTVLLGAASNLTDRAQYGWTTDYLIFFNRSAVNIADGMIILGLLVLAFRGNKKAPQVA